MPTKRALFVFIFSLVLLIGAWASKLVFLYFAFSVCIGLLILSFIFSKFLILNLELNRELPANTYEGSFVSVLINLRSRLSLFDQSIEIEDMFSAAGPQGKTKKLYVNGISNGKVRFSYQEKCYKRGKYRVGPFKVKIFEPLVLFYLEKQILVYSTLVVYPEVFTVNYLPFVLGHLAPRYGEQTTRISGNYEEFYGIREYQQEDGLRKIHWRSTARLSELMVKHFEQSAQWKATLVLDAAGTSNVGFGKESTFEYAVKILASIGKYLLHKNASFGFLANTIDPINIYHGKGRNHYYKILDQLAVIDSKGSMALHKFLARLQWSIPESSSLIIASNQFSPMLLKILNYLKIQKNIGIIPIVLNSDSFVMDYKEKDKIANKTKMLKNLFNKISPRVFVVNKKDDLKIHFIK
jgi:uncharacterized protein (DUF58 family)